MESEYQIVNEIIESLEKEPERWRIFLGLRLERDDFLRLSFGIGKGIKSNNNCEIVPDRKSWKLLKKARKKWEKNIALKDFAYDWEQKWQKDIES